MSNVTRRDANHSTRAKSHDVILITFFLRGSNTLLNLGLVKWQGKMDGDGAIADWQKLVTENPNYEGKVKVEQMIADVKKHAAVKP